MRGQIKVGKSAIPKVRRTGSHGEWVYDFDAADLLSGIEILGHKHLTAGFGSRLNYKRIPKTDNTFG